MIACLRLPALPEPELRALRLRLDRLSPRVQLLVAGGPAGEGHGAGRRGALAEILLDMGRGTPADGRRHAAALHAAVGGLPPVGDGASPPGPAAVGVAPAPTVARLAARYAAEVEGAGVTLVVGPGAVPALLARCPAGWLAELAPHALALHGLGLGSLAAVAALPAAAMGGRFGGAALGAWRALHGDEPPLAPLPAPPRLRARRRFDGPVADQGALALALACLAGRLAAALERRGAQARALSLHLHGDGGPYAAGRVLAQPAAGAAALAPIAAALLAAAGVGAGVEAAELVVGELVPLRGEQLALFAAAPARADEQRGAMADLAARLAPGRLLRASLAPAGAALAEERGRLAPY